MDTIESVMRRALAQKQQRRRALAALPYEEKLRILLRMQHMADAIRQTRGLAPRAWQISEDTLMPLDRSCGHSIGQSIGRSINGN